jgi:deazaflavin-dependent oxidoreductase (nitroreductase family)
MLPNHTRCREPHSPDFCVHSFEGPERCATRGSGYPPRVVSRIPAGYVVASGFGDRAQWFRNVRANPRVRVYAGGRKPTPATARLLTPAEAQQAVDGYAASHPRSWAALAPVFETTLGAPAHELPLIALELSR